MSEEYTKGTPAFDLNDDYTLEFDPVQSTSMEKHIYDIQLSSGEPTTSKDISTSQISSFPDNRLEKSDVIGMEFESIDKAESFYSKYSKAMGFSIRRDTLKKNKQGQITVRRWVYSKQGFRLSKWMDRTDRVREPRSITRQGCNAAFRVCLDRDSMKYIAKDFVDGHNHELVSSNQVQFLRSHRLVQDSDFAIAKSLHRVGIKTSQVMEYIVDQSGAYKNVGFIRKDLQNRLDTSRRQDIKDTDSESIISYLLSKQEIDLGLFFQYTIDEENRLADLFWCDSGSRYDYHCFGDVLSFNSTYKKNAYNMPLVTLVGCNHHRRTTVFGFALLSNETVDTYIWLLETFLAAMDNKKPKAFITDGDKAMKIAINRVMPDSVHRLCCWHLNRNAQQNISDVNFSHDFKKCLKTYMATSEEFDKTWFGLIDTYGLRCNEWAKKIYEERHHWAETFLRGQFMAGMRSTQRCESMNSNLKRFLQSKIKLFEFVLHTDRLMSRLRNTEANDDYESFNTHPVLCTHLHNYEKHAAEVYTRNVFKKVRKQIEEEGLLIIHSSISDSNRI